MSLASGTTDPNAAVQRIRVGHRTLVAVSDGYFQMGRQFLGTTEHPTIGHDALAATLNPVRLPIGCFFLPGERNVLIDTGYGPGVSPSGSLTGGNLLAQLAAIGVHPDSIDFVVLSHMHLDHVGTIGDLTGRPTFRNANVMVGAEDWDYFITSGRNDSGWAPHLRTAFDTLAAASRIILMNGETTIVTGLTRLPAPGHTPGHSLYVVHDAGERLLILGDMLYCPQQLTEPDWGAASDVDPVLARLTRRRWLGDLEQHGGRALGCHFPELLAGRILARPENALG